MSRNGSSFHAAADNLETLRVSGPVDKSLWKRERERVLIGPMDHILFYFISYLLIAALLSLFLRFLFLCCLSVYPLILTSVTSVTTFATSCGKIWPESRRSYGWNHIQNPNDSVKSKHGSIPSNWPASCQIGNEGFDAHKGDWFASSFIKSSRLRRGGKNEAENKNGQLGCMKLYT